MRRADWHASCLVGAEEGRSVAVVVAVDDDGVALLTLTMFATRTRRAEFQQGGPRWMMVQSMPWEYYDVQSRRGLQTRSVCGLDGRGLLVVLC